jgi:hypothetical protein
MGKNPTKKLSSGLTDAQSTARRSGLTYDQIETKAEAFANEMFLATGSQRFAGACYRIWTQGVSPLKRRSSTRQVDQSERSRWLAYKDRVWELTRLQPIERLENYEKRAFNGWHVDHVLSIKEAFDRGLPPEVPACISNLRMIPAEENIRKSTHTVFTDLFNAA